jgi:hypothetical protein
VLGVKGAAGVGIWVHEKNRGKIGVGVNGALEGAARAAVLVLLHVLGWKRPVFGSQSV